MNASRIPHNLMTLEIYLINGVHERLCIIDRPLCLDRLGGGWICLLEFSVLNTRSRLNQRKKITQSITYFKLRICWAYILDNINKFLQDRCLDLMEVNNLQDGDGAIY